MDALIDKARRTKIAVGARKSVVDRLGLPANTPFVEAAKALIVADSLLVSPIPATLPDACQFFEAYGLAQMYGRPVKGNAEGFKRRSAA